jgi:transposase-like protein
VEREATPEPLMRLSIQLHAAELSFLYTVSILDWFGVDRVRSTVHNLVQKTDLKPRSDRSRDHVAVEETVVQLNDQRYWLDAAVDHETNVFLHLKLLPARTTAVTEILLQELMEKHDVSNAVFLVDGAPWLQAKLLELRIHFRNETFGERKPCRKFLPGYKMANRPVL